MPLSPQKQRERRAKLKKQGINPANVSQELKAKKIPRRACRNCDGKFWKTRKNKLFCCKRCKDEYGRYGAAYGPLKAKLEKLIRATIAAEVAAIHSELAALKFHVFAQEDISRALQPVQISPASYPRRADASQKDSL